MNSRNEPGKHRSADSIVTIEPSSGIAKSRRIVEYIASLTTMCRATVAGGVPLVVGRSSASSSVARARTALSKSVEKQAQR